MKVLLYNMINREDMQNMGFVPLAYILLEEYLSKYSSDIEVFRYDHIIADGHQGTEYEDYHKYDIVGFQLTYPNCKAVLDLIEQWEQKKSRPFIVFGGVLASAIAFELMEKYPHIDVVVIAEGEDSLLQLTRALSGAIEMKDVPGIVYRNGDGELGYNRGKRPIDFDETPIPVREFLDLVPKEELRRTSIRMQSARGCLGGCSFCMNSYKNRLDKVTTKAWRGMSPERTVAEIEYLYNRYGVRLFNFVDPSFEDPGKKGKERIARIANLLLEKDLRISFKVNMRAETFTDKDIDLLKLLKKAGMDVIILGIEASTNEELKLFGKNADIETATKAYWRLQNMDSFFVLVGFIAVHPYATIELLQSSYSYVNSIGKSYSFNIFNCVLIPLRGTNIYDRMLADGLIANPGEILEIPTYRFKDQRVACVNEGIQKLKIENPVLTKLNKTIWNAENIIARSTNRIFDDMLQTDQINLAFKNFKTEVQKACDKLSGHYYALQNSMIDLAEKRWDMHEFEDMARETILNYAPGILGQVEDEINKYIRLIKHANYDTSILEFSSWGSYCQEKMKIGNEKVVKAKTD